MSSLAITSAAGLIVILGSAYVFSRWDMKGFFFIVPAALLGILLYDKIFSINSELLASLIASSVIGGAAGYTIRNRRSLQFFLLIAALGSTGVFTANYYYLKAVKNVDLFTESRSSFVEYLNRNAEGIKEEKKKELIQQVDQSLEIVKDLVPFSYFLNSLLFAAFTFIVMRMFAKRFFGSADINTEGLEYFRLSDYFIFVLIGGWLIFLLVDTAANRWIHAAGFNIALIFTFLYLIQAFGIIKFFFLKKNLPVYLLPLIIIMSIVLLNQYMLIIAIFLASFGAIDFWADFRKLESPGIKGSDQE